MKKSIVSSLLATTLLFSIFQIPTITSANSKINNEESKQVLIEHGYTDGTADALPDGEKIKLAEQIEKDPEKVDIVTSVMEIDNLSEIENFLSNTDEELVSMGLSVEQIDSASNEINEMLDSSDSELKTEYGMSDTEIKMLRKAEENAEEINEGNMEKDTKQIENCVDASGSISSTVLTYTQTVSDRSTTTAPSYFVYLTYSWKSVYALACFDDKIVAAWGGGLNTSYATSGAARATYYSWSTIGGSFNSKMDVMDMSRTETAQAGVEFTLPQSYNGYKTKSGYAGFSLYQLKKQGYATKVLSHYCHHVFNLDTSIDITTSGPSVSLSIGDAWDRTSQKASTISY